MQLPDGAPEPVKKRGTMAGSVESVCTPVVGSEADDTPEPGAITFRERKARLSIVAGLMASHTLAVNVVCHKGVASGGKAVMPVTTVHPAEHVSVAAELCPAVSTCDGDRYQNTAPLVLVPVRVPVTGVVMVNSTDPVRIWHGVTLLQLVPSLCTEGELLLTAKSPTEANPAPVVPPIRLQVFGDVQPYKFWPAGAFVLKNASPTEQEDGIVVPALAGLVETAPEKSTSFDWVARSTWVWPSANAMAANKSMIDLTIRQDWFIVFIVVHHQRL